MPGGVPDLAYVPEGLSPRIVGGRLPSDWTERIIELQAKGATINAIAGELGVARQTVTNSLRRAGIGGRRGARPNPKFVSQVPIPPTNWLPETRKAMNDRTGRLFCKRYFGMDLSPWQCEMWEELEAAWRHEGREYLCVNAPPGLGKSTVLVAFAAKLSANHREIRGLFMSRAVSLAERNVNRLRRALERQSPYSNADATLVHDFGVFRCTDGDWWRSNALILEQWDGMPIEEKEPSWAAFGFDSEWLGNRLDILIGDDLDSTRTVRSMDTIERNRDIFDRELEPRVDAPRIIPHGTHQTPVGGLMVIAQQRLGAFDFSAHALAKRIVPDDDGSDVDFDESELELQYRQIIFKAHYEEKCIGIVTHKPGAPPWPKGCLLDPRQLGWRDCRKAMRDRRTFELVYQQNDLSDESSLVKELWIEGGRDTKTGQFFVGCWDDRRVWELPHTLGDLIGVVTVDPSVEKFWGNIAWAYDPITEQRIALDIHRARMQAPDLLEWSFSEGKFVGLLEDWYANFGELGVRLSWVIVEANAAHRYMLQYEHFHRWMRQRSVQVISHSTQRNKLDADLGVQMLGPVYRDGKIRLPGKDLGMHNGFRDHLVREVTRYPHTTTFDCGMSHWFLEANLERIYSPEQQGFAEAWRPSWLTGARS